MEDSMQQGYGIHLPKLTPLNKILIIITASSFFLQSILAKTGAAFVLNYVPLVPANFFSGHIYELITYPFLAQGVFEVLFECLLFWFVGSELESIWGKKLYAKFLIVVVIGGGLLYLGLMAALSFLVGPTAYMSPLMGLAGVTSFLLLAYAILYPNQIFTFALIFPMKAKYFCAIIIGLFFFYGVFGNYYGAFGHLGLMGVGYAYMVWLSSPRFKKWRAYFTRAPKNVQNKRKKSHLKLVKNFEDDDNEGGPKYWQ